ncbi:MAG: chemotaxis response regulator protein-glutamate methylesterase [Bdellovibrionales bacterium]|nr:chemotaxis response regulator protein-glutamate methylesterase [Bdellovibrionales bacterium]
MPIKKLMPGNSSLTTIHLNKEDGVLVFNQDEEGIFLYIENKNDTNFSKLSKFSDPKNICYIGSKELFKKIKEAHLNWPRCEKKMYLSDSIDLTYNHELQKIDLSNFKLEEELEKKNVLIVDDSKTIQKLLAKIIESSTKLKVTGIANNPIEAKAIIEQNKPDLITLDIHMPEMDGVEFLKTYLQDKHIPTVMISSVSINEGPLVMEALSHGAQTYIQKPSLENIKAESKHILNQLEAVADLRQKKPIVLQKAEDHFNHNQGLIVIGSSTGGTKALQDIFTSLPDEIPPILVVQHIPKVFSKALADNLNRLCVFEVKEAENGDKIEPNTVYIAPGDHQMKLTKNGGFLYCEINEDPPLNHFKPSVDYLFKSVSEIRINNLIAVILTGMGKDGALGMLDIYNKGGYTLAQDEESCVVFGMPKEAIEVGAVHKIVSLSDMAQEIVSQFNKQLKKAV